MNIVEDLIPEPAVIEEGIANLEAIAEQLQPSETAGECFDRLIEQNSRNLLEQLSYKKIGSYLCAVEHLNLAIAYLQKALGGEVKTGL